MSRPVQLMVAALLAPGASGQPVTQAAEQPPLEQGRALFTKGTVPACSLCHALKAAGSEGAVGPSLDDLKPDAARVARAMRDGIGLMPSHRGTLSDAQILAVAECVAKAAAAGR